MGTLRPFAIRATCALALAIGGVAASVPSAAFAASDVYGVVSERSPGVVANTFGSIDPTTGGYSPIADTPSIDNGYYAPVFDPARNSFFVPFLPLNSGSAFSNTVTEINAATGGVASIDVTQGGSARTVLGLGVDPASSQLYGFVHSGGDAVFGKIDPVTGDFTQIGGPTGLPVGYFAPAFDPARNSFFVPSVPIGPAFSNIVTEIDAATGGAASIDVTQGGSARTVLGLGVDPASSQLYGFVHSGGDAVFGKIDPVTGDFTPIGGPTPLPVGNYAPVFDPQTNSFLVTDEPISENTFANVIGEIDPTTGVFTSTQLNLVPPNPVVTPLVFGLGVASSPVAVVPEPSTWAMMLLGFAGLGYAAFRRNRRSDIVDGVLASEPPVARFPVANGAMRRAA